MQGRQQALIQIISKFSEDINTLMFGRVFMHLYNDEANPREKFNHHFQFISDKETVCSLNKKTAELRANRIGKEKNNVFFSEQLLSQLPDYLSNDHCFFESAAEVLTHIQYNLTGMKWILLQKEPNMQWFLDCLIELEKASSHLLAILSAMPEFFCKGDDEYQGVTIENASKKFEIFFAYLQEDLKIKEIISAEVQKREEAKKSCEDKDIQVMAIIVGFKQLVSDLSISQNSQEELKQILITLDNFLRLISQFDYFSQGMVDELDKKFQSISKSLTDKKQASAFNYEYKEFIAKLKADLFFKNILSKPPQLSTPVTVDVEPKKQTKSTKRKAIVQIPEPDYIPPLAEEFRPFRKKNLIAAPKLRCPSTPRFFECEMVLLPKQVVKGFMFDSGAPAYLKKQEEYITSSNVEEKISLEVVKQDAELEERVEEEIKEEKSESVSASIQPTDSVIYPPKFSRKDQHLVKITAIPTSVILCAAFGALIGLALAPFTGGLSLTLVVACAVMCGIVAAGISYLVSDKLDEKRIEAKTDKYYKKQGWGTAKIWQHTPAAPAPTVEIIVQKGQTLSVAKGPKNDAMIHSADAVELVEKKTSFSL